MDIGLSATRLMDFSGQPKELDGIGQYTKMLAQCLGSAGNNIHYYYFRHLKECKKQACSQQLFLTQPFNLYSCLLPPQIALHQKIESQVDIFHSTDYLIPRLHNTPVIATLHDAIMLKHTDMVSYRFRALKNYLLKKSASWADGVIAISHYIIPDLVKYFGVPEKKIHVVYNGIADEWFTELDENQTQTILNKYQIKKDYLLCVGTLQPRKNIARLTRAFLKLPKHLKQNYQLIVIGKKGWMYEETMEAIQELQDKKLGMWISYVTDEELKAIYQKATGLVFPSLSEGFGYPIVEGFASKIPVVSSNQTSLPEVAGNAALLFNPYKENKITEALEALLTNSTLRAELVQKGLKQVQKFRMDVYKDNIFRVYNNFML